MVAMGAREIPIELTPDPVWHRPPFGTVTVRLWARRHVIDLFICETALCACLDMYNPVLRAQACLLSAAR